MGIITCPDKRWHYLVVGTESHFTKLKIPGNGKRFENKWILISEDGLIFVKDGYAFDGATMVPDMYFAVKGAAFHDPFYQFAKEMSEVWECSVWAVIRFADKLFYEVMKKHSKGYNILPTVYYAGVSVFGYSWWRSKRFCDKLFGK